MTSWRFIVIHAVIFWAQPCLAVWNTQEDCIQFVSNSLLSLDSSKLDIDSLIRSYHDYNNLSLSSLGDQSIWEHSIDLTCLKGLTGIENSKTDEKYIDLVRLTTGTTNSSAESDLLKAEFTIFVYKAGEFVLARFYVTIFISCAQCIESLDLRNNPSLLDISSGSLCLLKNLTYLNLASNRIGEEGSLLPSSFKGLEQLTQLILSGNELSLIFEETKINVSLFEGLASLTKLGLSTNQIGKLKSQSFLGLGKLVDLDLSGNVIKTIANGTFSPLVSLERVDLRRNQLRNLYFFGLSYNCSIFHDGLSLFNISSIDLGQMTLGRSKSFLQKTIHLRGRKTLPVYRNVQVDWRSSSERANCSLYFFVLREYRVISFQIDWSYIEACYGEEVDLIEPSFFQETLENIEAVRSFSHVMTLPPGIDFYGTTSDGFVIGLPHTKSKIVILDLRQNAVSCTIQLSEKSENLVIISNDLLLIERPQDQVSSLWNISDKSNASLIDDGLPYEIIADSQFHVSQFSLVTLNLRSRLFCLIDLSARPLSYKILDFWVLDNEYFYIDEEFDLKSFTIWKNEYFVNRIYDRAIRIWNWEGLIKSVPNFPFSMGIPYDMSKSRPIFVNQAIRHIESTPDGYLVTTDASVFKLWSIYPNGTLHLVSLIAGTPFEKATVFRSNRRNETLAALCGKKFVKVWSLRYTKLVEIIPSEPAFSKNCTSSYDTGLLLLGDKVYQF